MNYVDHCEEQNKPIPQEPLVFNKFPSCIVGPADSIPYPEISQELDWEVELVIVIGKSGFQIPKDKAMDHVFGFTVAHDVSARDWQLRKNGGTYLLIYYGNTGCVANVYAVLPFYNVKCLCSRGGNERGRKATPTSISIFDFYGIKVL